jgi:branched-chain amino acid transport system ATP-binding protein
LENSLVISGLSAGYGRVLALHDVSLTVEAGETVALLGTNGNGKSSLMKCVMGAPSFCGKHYRADRR